MTGLRLLTHSLRMIFGNLRSALRLTGVIYAVLVVAQYFYLKAMFGLDGVISVGALGKTVPPIGTTIFFAVATMFGSIWIAIAWHRFVLLEEDNGHFLPRMNSKSMLEYLGVSFMLMLVLLIPFFFSSLIGGLLLVPSKTTQFSGLSGLTILLFPLVFLPTVYLFFRLSPMLPSAAVGRSIKMTDAFNVTKPMSKALWTLAFLELLVSAASGFLGEFLFPKNLTLLIIENAILGWVIMMVNVSVITTIYGVSVEGREVV